MAEHGGEFLCVDGHVAVDQAPFVKAIVNGSKQFSRDLNENAESVLDPEGDKAYADEIAKHGRVDETRMCASPLHKGERWLPVGRFTGKDRYCLACRGELEHLRRTRSAEQQGRKLRKYNTRTTVKPRAYGRS